MQLQMRCRPSIPHLKGLNFTKAIIKLAQKPSRFSAMVWPHVNSRSCIMHLDRTKEAARPTRL